uniref:Putative ovule protein n=1 Tax=Solanum chacoense TaxID=4108 RepID=A0A0V0HB32_SOLCH
MLRFIFANESNQTIPKRNNHLQKMNYKEIHEKPKIADNAKDRIDLISYIRCCARHNRNKLFVNLLENFGTLREVFINGIRNQ